MRDQELTQEEYLATMSTRMRFIEAEDSSYGPFPIGDYVATLIDRLKLPTTRKQIEVHAVYVNDEAGYCHVLLNWGRKNVFLVIVTRPAERQVHGYRVLDLNKEYGID